MRMCPFSHRRGASIGIVDETDSAVYGEKHFSWRDNNKPSFGIRRAISYIWETRKSPFCLKGRAVVELNG